MKRAITQLLFVSYIIFSFTLVDAKPKPFHHKPPKKAPTPYRNTYGDRNRHSESDFHADIHCEENRDSDTDSISGTESHTHRN